MLKAKDCKSQIIVWISLIVNTTNVIIIKSIKKMMLKNTKKKRYYRNHI